MTKRHLPLKEWAKAVNVEWKHVPSLKGKQYLRHLFILRTLAVNPTPKSAWDLALDFLKQTNDKFSEWIAATVYYQRQKENPKMHRRLKFLEEKGYVRKLGSVYKLTSKGVFLIWILDPEVMTQMPDSFFNETISDVKVSDFTDMIEERDLTPEEVAGLKTLPFWKDPIAKEVLSFTVRRCLFSWKINVDDISEQELWKIILLKLEKMGKKQGISKIGF